MAWAKRKITTMITSKMVNTKNKMGMAKTVMKTKRFLIKSTIIRLKLVLVLITLSTRRLHRVF